MGSNRALIAALIAVVLAIAGYWFFSSRDDIPVQSMVTGIQRQNELTVLRAQVVTVPTSKEGGMFGLLDREQTSIVPATIRYTIDLSGLNDRDVRWDASTQTATITVPGVTVQPAELDAVAKRVFRTGPPASAATWDKFDRSNMIKAKREAAQLARAPELLRMAEASARDAIARNAELFLRGAGAKDAKVVVRFANEDRSGSEQMNRSTPLNEAVAR